MADPPPRIELVQSFHKLGDVEHNLKIILKHVNESNSDLLIFPEMFLTGYTLGRDISRESMGLDDTHLQVLIDACSKTGRHVIFGFPERSGEIRGQIHNSAILIGPDGIKGVYRKNHLVDFGPFEEWSYFTPGNEPFIFDIMGFRFGLIICYDIFFPELTKQYALKGADGVICISASPSMTRPYFEAVMRARAIENTIYFIYSNLVGFDSRMDFWGGAEIIDPFGETVGKAPYFEEGTISFQMDKMKLFNSRAARPTLRDTKADIARALKKWGK